MIQKFAFWITNKSNFLLQISRSAYSTTRFPFFNENAQNPRASTSSRISPLFHKLHATPKMSCLAMKNKSRSPSFDRSEDSFIHSRSLPAITYRSSTSTPEKSFTSPSIAMLLPSSPESEKKYVMLAGKKVYHSQMKSCRVVLSPLKWSTKSKESAESSSDRQTKTQSKKKTMDYGNSPVYQSNSSESK